MRYSSFRKVLWVSGVLLLTLAAGHAQAARRAKVDVDGTDLLRAPRADAASILKLKRGQKVAASNYPTAGYYKVRTADGTLGWVKADTLILGPMPDLTSKKASKAVPSE